LHRFERSVDVAVLGVVVVLDDRRAPVDGERKKRATARGGV
jgi:hypothetical protein